MQLLFTVSPTFFANLVSIIDCFVIIDCVLEVILSVQSISYVREQSMLTIPDLERDSLIADAMLDRALE